MVSIALYLDTRQTNLSGKYTIKVRITQNRKSNYIPTDIKVRKEEWDVKSQSVINTRLASRYNAYLRSKLVEIDKFILNLNTFGSVRDLTEAELKEKIKCIIQYGEESVYTMHKNGQFWELINEIATKTTRSIGTRRNYQALANALKRYDPQIEQKTYKDLNEDYWLTYIETRKKSLKRNSIYIELARIKTVLNEAVKREHIKANPCKDIKVPGSVPTHRNLSADQLRKMFMAETPKKQAYADLYKLSFLLRGMNLADLRDARLDQIVNGRLIYERRKTSTHYSVKIEPEAMEIIDKYKGNGKLVENLNYYQTIYYFKKRKTTFYSARHSVASIASELGIPLDVIAQILGHKIRELNITLGYVTYKQDMIDKAMRKVIDFVLYGKKR